MNISSELLNVKTFDLQMVIDPIQSMPVERLDLMFAINIDPTPMIKGVYVMAAMRWQECNIAGESTDLDILLYSN